MTELDPDTKARIEAEERYRAELRAQQEGPSQQATIPAVTQPPARKRMGCGGMLLWGIVALFVLGLLSMMFSPKPTTPSPTSATTNTPSAASEPPPATTSEGATVEADGSQSVGVWNVSDVSWSQAQQAGGEFGEKAGEGETFIFVKYTLRNTTNETQSYSSLIDQPQLVLADGSLIDSDTMLAALLGDQIIDGQIAPGLKRSGSYGFRVPSGKTAGMKFQIQFFNGKRVSFDLVE